MSYRQRLSVLRIQDLAAHVSIAAARLAPDEPEVADLLRMAVDLLNRAQRILLKPQ